VSPRVSLDVRKRTPSFRYRKSNHERSAVHGVAHPAELSQLPNDDPVYINEFTVVRIVFSSLRICNVQKFTSESSHFSHAFHIGIRLLMFNSHFDSSRNMTDSMMK
jgi:hypothetical protein